MKQSVRNALHLNERSEEELHDVVTRLEEKWQRKAQSAIRY